MTKQPSLLETVLGDFVAIFLKNMTAEMPSEEGMISVPMVLEGIVADYDDDFVLLTDDPKENFSLISRDTIAKIDIINDSMLASAAEPNKPKKFSDMN